MTVTGDLQTAVRKVRLRNSSMEGHAMCVSGEKGERKGTSLTMQRYCKSHCAEDSARKTALMTM